MHLKPQQKPINEDKATHLVAGQLEVFGTAGKPLPTSFNRGMSLDAIAALLGHYAGDLVKLILSERCLVEPRQQAVEDLLPAGLSLGGGVVTLPFEDGAELDGGLEEYAGFADRLEVAVQAHRPRAVAVAEHAPVHLCEE
jgi:hypothetical protein